MRLGIDASNIRIGGGLTHLIELLRVANPGSHGISRVVVWAGSQTLKELPDRPWLSLVHEPFLDKSLPFRLYWQGAKLTKLARESCDILFVPGGSYLGSFSPYVTMSQNLLPFDRKNPNNYAIFSCGQLRMVLLRQVQSYSFRRADGLIFLTEFAHSKIVGQLKGIKGRTVIIPHGVTPSFYRPPRPQRPIDNYSSDNPLKLLYVSNINFYKHQVPLVEAVAHLKLSGYPLELLMVGPKGHPQVYYDHLQGVIKSLDPGMTFIKYLGPTPYLELPGVYQSADLFVFASSCENLPIILLEAMASGLPIACSDRGPMPHVLGDAGVYFDPENPDKIAKALKDLITSPSLRSYLANSAFEMAKIYSWDRCAEETLTFISKIARKSSS